MKTKTYVSIPQPCHEKWEAMIPQDKGRYCASCAKTVVDFSAMSDTQVLHYLTAAKGRLCGRFAPDQLERPLQPVTTEKKKVWWMAALMPMLLFVSKLNAQKKTGTITAEKVASSQYNIRIGKIAVQAAAGDTAKPVTEKIITGRIIDADSMPIQGASVIINGSNIGTATDSSGTFKLRFPKDLSSNVVITYVGYEQREIAFTTTDNSITELGKIVLQPMFMGDVVVVAGGISYYQPVKKADTIAYTIRKVFHTEAFKVYPNPARRGAAVKIDVKKEGYYTIQLLDAGSKLIHTAIFDAVKGAAITSFQIPASAAAGVYFIRLINDDTKKQYTEKIVVE